MRWKDLFNGAVTAALSGGATTAGAMIIDPEHFNLGLLKHLGIVFAAGAVMGLINWLRQSPWKSAATATDSIDPRRFTQVGAIILLAGMMPLVAACGNTVRHLATSVDAGFATAVFAADDEWARQCKPAPPATLPPGVTWAPLVPRWCAPADPLLKKALTDVGIATTAIKATPKDALVLPKGLPDLVGDLVRVQGVVAPLTAADGSVGPFASKVSAAIDAALKVLNQFAGGH